MTTAHRPPREASGGSTLDTATPEGSWHLRARCRGMPAEVFFADDHHRGQRRVDHENHAKFICGGCPVQFQCRTYAISVQEPHGIWGGTTPRERAALRRSSEPQPTGRDPDRGARGVSSIG
ncbi:WhiB family transcriptional regulator [Mycolicibacterium palauense]|uniref:WhiB family transcriptional regulator n=1 Tax=Mycolicibacterium palauense TaxID=2034511 RepID=UPI002481F863|nr:WhiB family transcriptional regulator [Mycolicibacterium palauense]